MNVLPLGPPGRPRDGGLAQLGLVMMATAIAGGALAWCAGVIAVVDTLFSMVANGEDVSLLQRAPTWVVMVAAVLTALRAVAGYAAGRALVTGRDARRAFGGYALAGAAHAVAVGMVIAPTWTSVEIAAVIAALAVLPLAAGTAAPFVGARERTGVREAVPVLATLAGVVAIVIATVLFLPSAHLARLGLDASGGRWALVPPVHTLLLMGTALGAIAAVIAIGLAVVGALMIRAGFGGAAALDRATRASDFVGFVLAIALSILVLTAIVIPAIVALAMAFPRLLRTASAAEPPRPHDPGGRRAALAWILLGHGLIAVVTLVPAALAGTSTTLAASIAAAPGDGWAGVALAALELTAAVALLSGWRTARLLTVGYGAGGVALAAAHAPAFGAWFAIVPAVALLTSPLTETLRARATLVRSLGA